jgi:hypothetical protein
MDHVGIGSPPLAGRPSQATGRVLRVKSGYNPNSSSIGSALPTYMVLTAAAGALTVMLLHLTGAVAARLRREKKPPAQPPDSPSSDDSAGHEQPSPQ